MDDDGRLGTRNWTYFAPTLKEGLRLQLVSNTDSDVKPLIDGSGGFLSPQPQLPGHLDIGRDGWENKNYHNYGLPFNATYPYHHPQQRHPHAMLPAVPSMVHPINMIQSPDPPNEDIKPTIINEQSPGSMSETSVSQGPSSKSPKPKKSKKAKHPRGDVNGSADGVKKNTGLVINGIDLDLNGLPTPVCSCTGAPQQCYKWGIGGWQSACCTMGISVYPLPMSTKRKGARIAGRKMSMGAFKKVLEKLVGEGYDLSNPIDLKMFWAKHGTNKFVTIR